MFKFIVFLLVNAVYSEIICDSILNDSVHHYDCSKREIHENDINDFADIGFNTNNLDLSFNNISLMYDFMFKNFTQLNGILNLSFNLISKIEIFSYFIDHSSTLLIKTLDISSNQLEEYPFKQTVELSELENIILDYNNINFISSNGLIINRVLKKISLKECNIKKIFNGFFDKFYALEYLDLTRNKLKIISNDFVTSLNLLFIELQGNKLECRCNLKWILNSNFKENVICFDNDLDEWVNLTRANLDCRPQHILYSLNITQLVSEEIFVMIQCFVIGFPKPDIIWMKDNNNIKKSYLSNNMVIEDHFIQMNDQDADIIFKVESLLKITINQNNTSVLSCAAVQRNNQIIKHNFILLEENLNETIIYNRSNQVKFQFLLIFIIIIQLF